MKQVSDESSTFAIYSQLLGVIMFLIGATVSVIHQDYPPSGLFLAFALAVFVWWWKFTRHFKTVFTDDDAFYVDFEESKVRVAFSSIISVWYPELMRGAPMVVKYRVEEAKIGKLTFLPVRSAVREIEEKFSQLGIRIDFDL